MNISYVEKPKQMERSLGRDANAWPNESGTIWRVVASNNEDFKIDQLILYLATKYKGYAWINLDTKQIHTSEIKNGHEVKIVQDFTVNVVNLAVDNSARP